MEKNGHDANDKKADGDTKPAKEEHHAPADEGNGTPKKRRKVNHGMNLVTSQSHPSMRQAGHLS
jgi:hypothetical protein